MGDAALARHLQGELERLRAASAHAALGLALSATVADARAAFLQATKTYHPSLYARRNRDVVRLANEVFLLLKQAYNELGGERTAPPRRSELDNSSATGAPAPQPGHSRGSREPVASSAARGARSAPLPHMAQTAAHVRPTSRDGVPSSPPRAASGPAANRSGQSLPVMASSSGPAVQPMAVSDAKLARHAAELLKREHWSEARSVLAELVSRRPGERKLQAHLHYAHGRQLQEQGALAGARDSYQRALDADRTFDMARLAAATLSVAGKGAKGPRE